MSRRDTGSTTRRDTSPCRLFLDLSFCRRKLEHIFHRITVICYKRPFVFFFKLLCKLPEIHHGILILCHFLLPGHYFTLSSLDDCKRCQFSFQQYFFLYIQPIFTATCYSDSIFPFCLISNNFIFGGLPITLLFSEALKAAHISKDTVGLFRALIKLSTGHFTYLKPLSK